MPRTGGLLLAASLLMASSSNATLINCSLGGHGLNRGVNRYAEDVLKLDFEMRS